MHKQFMSRAIELSTRNIKDGRGGPFGAVIVRGGKIVAEGANKVTATNDPTAHAEVVAIREACRALGAYELRGCDLYSSCEPCPMCLSAAYWSRLDRIYFGSSAADAAAAGFDDAFILEQLKRPAGERSIEIDSLMRDEALEAFRMWDASPMKIKY